VHLADAGYPVVGDKIYGRKRQGRLEGVQGVSDFSVIVNFQRHALHAEELALTHPRSGLPLKFHASLAEDMRKLVQWLKQMARA
jgi:23S rRNA pseudouridine1911/1915/1917 synthase